jgi:hypothetical protein
MEGKPDGRRTRPEPALLTRSAKPALRHVVPLGSELRTWLRRRRGESDRLQRGKLFQGTKHRGHEFIAAAVSSVIENV